MSVDAKDILKTIPIEQVVEALGGLGLKRAGRHLQGNCPSGHDSKGGACFSINAQGNYFHCFNCGAGGDVVALVELVRGVEFFEAMKWLAEKFRPDLLSDLGGGLRAGGPTKEDREKARLRFQTGSLYDLVYEMGRKMLLGEDPEVKPVRDYLTDVRGYKAEDLASTEWFFFPPEHEVRRHLREARPEAEEQIKRLSLNGRLGDKIPLAIPYRDRNGTILGFAKRAIDPNAESKDRWDYTAGMERPDLFGLHNCRGAERVLIVEGIPDVAYLPTVGIPHVAAVGTASFSEAYLDGLKALGVKQVVFALDNQPKKNNLDGRIRNIGEENTAKALKVLAGSGIKGFVIDPPALGEHKDPDEFARGQSPEDFQRLLKRAEEAPKWMARHFLRKVDLETDMGKDEAIRLAVSYSDGASELDRQLFEGAFQAFSGMKEEEFNLRIKEKRTALAEEAEKKAIQEALGKAQAAFQAGDKEGFKKALEKAQGSAEGSDSIPVPEPYLLSTFVSDLDNFSSGLKTGYPSLDEKLRIPDGAITIVAGRPGHGKTTFLLNLLVRMVDLYPSKRFAFFTYEEPSHHLVVKLILQKAGEILNRQKNFGAYIRYFKHGSGANPKIEEAWSWYKDVSESGRLVLSDQGRPAEDLAVQLGMLAEKGDLGAVFVDYIQKIPLRQRASSQRYLDIKAASGILLAQIVRTNTPLIMGAQFNREGPKDGGGEKFTPRLDYLRESGDIEQDANLVLALVNDTLVRASSENLVEAIYEDAMAVWCLKNRAGASDWDKKFLFDKPVLCIKESHIGKM